MEIYNKEENNEYSFIKYIPNFINEDTTSIIHQELINEEYTIGKTDYNSEIPRVQKWMHNNNLPFSLSWKKQYDRWQPRKYSKEIKKIQDNILNMYLENNSLPEGVNKPEINSSLINKYRSGNDSIAFHRDNLPEFGENPTILILSFGNERSIQFKRVLYNHKNRKSMKIDKDNQSMNFNIKLENASLLIMGGSTQKYYAHGIDKTNNNVGERFSITFRQHEMCTN